MSDENDTREQGIEFGDFESTLDEIAYPIDNADLLARYGEVTLELPSGTATLDDVLSPYEGERFEGKEELRQAVFTMVGDDAVGREGYSDRGGSPESADVQDERDEQDSF